MKSQFQKTVEDLIDQSVIHELVKGVYPVNPVKLYSKSEIQVLETQMRSEGRLNVPKKTAKDIYLEELLKLTLGVE